MSKSPSFGARPRRAEIIDPAAADKWVGAGSEVQPDAPPSPEAPKLKPKRLTIDIEPELHRLLRVRTAEENTTIADVARELLDSWARKGRRV